jgi:crotonobetainyl-CoA:carnitine CoA-transferase CaiB-like acyl-CoA transferase
VRNLGELSALLRTSFAAWPRARLVAALDGAGVPCGAINSIPEVFEDPQVKARGMLKHVPHPCGSEVPQVASPMRFAEAAAPELAAPPLLGQHSDAILAELGYDAARIAALRTEGVI